MGVPSAPEKTRPSCMLTTFIGCFFPKTVNAFEAKVVAMLCGTERVARATECWLTKPSSEKAAELEIRAIEVLRSGFSHMQKKKLCPVTF